MPRERRQNGWVEKTGKKTKTWTGFWYEYVPVDGLEKRMQRSKVLGECSKMTKGRAEDALQEHIRGPRPPQTGATFAQLTEWYIKTNTGRWTKGWTGSVRAIFTHQINPRLGSMPADKIRRSDVQIALNEIAAQHNSQSKSIVGKCLTQIRAVFNFAIEDELLERNPALKIEMPQTRKESQRFLKPEEFYRLLSVADERDYLIVRLFLSVGLRPGELFALQVDDVLPGELRIDQTVREYRIEDGAKTEDSVGTVPLPPHLEAKLRDYVQKHHIAELLFPNAIGGPISPDNYLDRVLKPLGVLAGIPDLNHQVLRRTTGTHFQKHGKVKDTQSLLRHADPQTTLKHYQKTIDDSLRLARRKLGRGIDRPTPEQATQLEAQLKEEKA